jgi:DNA polymerase-4
MLPPSRHITHLDLDTFFVSVERLINPKLIGKPVLVGGSGYRGVVASRSYEARKFGIHSAMLMYTAKQFCSHAIAVKGDYESYSKYANLVTELIRDKVPMFEKSSGDEFYIDLTGMDRTFGSSKFSMELKKRIAKESALLFPMRLSVINLSQKSPPTR